MVADSLGDQWARNLRTDEEIEVIRRRLQLWHRTSEASRDLEETPGVGMLTATAEVAAMGVPQAAHQRGQPGALNTSVPAAGSGD